MFKKKKKKKKKKRRTEAIFAKSEMLGGRE